MGLCFVTNDGMLTWCLMGGLSLYKLLHESNIILSSDTYMLLSLRGGHYILSEDPFG